MRPPTGSARPQSPPPEPRGAGTEGGRGWIHAFDARWRETGAAAIIAAAGLLTSWASYQGAIWEGLQSADYTRSSVLQVNAPRVAMDAALDQAVELNLVRAWVDAKASGDSRLAAFYEARVPPSLQPAFREWLAHRPMEDPDAPRSPFAVASYRPPGFAQASALEAGAEQAFRTGMKARHTADAFHRAGVFLAMAMFFAGIGQVLTRAHLRLALLVLGAASLALGAVQVFVLPQLSLAALS